MPTRFVTNPRRNPRKNPSESELAFLRRAASKTVAVPPPGKPLPAEYKKWLAKAEKMLLEDPRFDSAGPALWSDVVDLYEESEGTWAGWLGRWEDPVGAVLDTISTTYPLWAKGRSPLSAVREYERITKDNRKLLSRLRAAHLAEGYDEYDPDEGDPYGFDTEKYAAYVMADRRYNPSQGARRNPRKYDEGRDDAGFRKLSDLKRGEAFKRKADARKVYRKGDYDRSERKYACDDEDDISRSIYLKGDALVYVGFDY